MSRRKAAKRRCFCENDARASAAQRARTRWKSGSQRKLQRKTPAVGTIARMKTTSRRASSQPIFFRRARLLTIKPASNAAGAIKPHASSAARCGSSLVEKLDQFTVHEGRISPGHAFQGTSHCQWAAGSKRLVVRNRGRNRATTATPARQDRDRGSRRQTAAKFPLADSDRGG